MSVADSRFDRQRGLDHGDDRDVSAPRAGVSDKGMVVAPHYLASLAGADVLRDGGNALDAAIAANAVMTVVWPHMCSMGETSFSWSSDPVRRLKVSQGAELRQRRPASTRIKSWD